MINLTSAQVLEYPLKLYIPNKTYIDFFVKIYPIEIQEFDELLYVVFITGTQTVFVKTWGCSHNSSDSEYMAGQLAAYGYKITGE